MIKRGKIQKNYINIIILCAVRCAHTIRRFLSLSSTYIFVHIVWHGHLSHTEIACKIMFIFFLLHHHHLRRRQWSSLWFDIFYKCVCEYCCCWPDNNEKKNIEQNFLPHQIFHFDLVLNIV